MSNRIYIAGPMTGKPHLNFEAFDFAKAHLEAGGWVVVSPADISRITYGWGKLPPEKEVEAKGRPALSKEELKQIMMTDLLALSGCDAIFMLHGWEESPGATVEIAYATFLKMELHFADDSYREEDAHG